MKETQSIDTKIKALNSIIKKAEIQRSTPLGKKSPNLVSSAPLYLLTPWELHLLVKGAKAKMEELKRYKEDEQVLKERQENPVCGDGMLPESLIKKDS